MNSISFASVTPQRATGLPFAPTARTLLGRSLLVLATLVGLGQLPGGDERDDDEGREADAQVVDKVPGIGQDPAIPGLPPGLQPTSLSFRCFHHTQITSH